MINFLSALIKIRIRLNLLYSQKRFVWAINLAVDYFVFTTGSFTIFSFRSILTFRCILWIQRNIFSLLSPTSSLFWHSYSDCIERHRSGKMREVEIYGPRINVDWRTGEDAFLSSQSALLLLNEGSAVIERPFATFVFSDSYNYLRKPLKDGPKIPSSCNNKSESFTNCYIEVGGSGS